MSIPNLPVDFKDDILASSNTKRKYRQTANDDSTVSFEDVTNYSQEGSEFGAKEVNQTNTAINNIYDERVLDADALELVTEPGFFVDALLLKDLLIGKDVGIEFEPNITARYCTCLSKNKRVLLNATFESNLTMTAQTRKKIATIPVEYRPYIDDVESACILNSTSAIADTIWGTVQVTLNGDVYIFCNYDIDSGRRNVRISISWEHQ